MPRCFVASEIRGRVHLWLKLTPRNKMPSGGLKNLRLSRVLFGEMIGRFRVQVGEMTRTLRGDDIRLLLSARARAKATRVANDLITSADTLLLSLLLPLSRASECLVLTI